MMTQEELDRIMASRNEGYNSQDNTLNGKYWDQSQYGAFDQQAYDNAQMEAQQLAIRKSQPEAFANMASTYGSVLPQYGIDIKTISDKAQKDRLDEYNQYMSTLPEWQQKAYKQIGADYNDPNYRNVRFLDNGTIIKSEVGGEGDYGIRYVQDNPESDLWYGKYDPTTGDVKDWTYQEGIRTQGNSFAPLFVGLGTLLTGGLLAPLAAGFGVAGSAALGAGLGAGSSMVNSSIANPGGGPDWEAAAKAGVMGGLGGAIGGYMKGFDWTGNGVSYGDFANEAEWTNYWDNFEPDSFTYGDFSGEADWEDYWNDFEDVPSSLDSSIKDATGKSLTDIAKSMGTNVAKTMLKQLVGGQNSQQSGSGVASGTAAGLMSSRGSQIPSLSSSSSLPEIQAIGSKIGMPISESEAKKIKTNFLKYDLSNDTLTPDYWRFMSDSEEGI